MASSSSSSTIIESSVYDVFLSFRGEDTRHAFVSFLHRALKDRGINVFLDSESLWTGEFIAPTLLAAINGSKISIPVFSEHYANSRWCLIELAQIVECHKSNGQLVLPIFFKVDPSNVRNQKEGSFAEAFQEYEKKNFEPQTIQDWRDALKVVGNLKGEVVDDTRDQAELVDLVVKRVLGELNRNTHWDVCKYPIGIEKPKNDVLSLLDFDSTDVLFVGIWGFGGIGKTTIAKAVYNHIMSTFSKHSFISDVREQASQNMGLVTLQQRLLKDILNLDNIDIPSHHVGKRLIKERLCKQRVFIVLDDVDSKEQVDALIGETNWFGQRSRVIITTRDEEILNKAKVHKGKIYRPTELNQDQSLQLFSLHAFESKLPPDDRMQLSNDVARYSGGLPLTLEVLGSLLSDEISVEEWESTLESLKEIPHEDIQKRLRISFDKLNDYQKEIFLDAACLFVGENKKYVTSIWEARGYHPSSAIPILIKRSLIKFENSFLRMHDQIRDMGRGIVIRENHTDPSKRTRLWSKDDIFQVLENNKGVCMVKSMNLDDVYIHLSHNPFEMMSNLEFLYIPSTVKGNFWSFPSKLRWLHWKSFHGIIPTNFYHRGLVNLQLIGHRNQQVWDTIPQDKNKFEKLKVLNLWLCGLSKSPNFSWFPNLEHLGLSYCNELKILDESIGQLSQLKSLNLRRCNQINELPDSMGDLKNLVELNISSKAIVTREFPRRFSLWERFTLSNSAPRIGPLKLPRSMGRMRCLHTLNLDYVELSELPDDFSRLSNLEMLVISWKREYLPVDLSQFNKLRILQLKQCYRLKELPEAPSSLVEFECWCCDSLVRIFDISRLKHLKVLVLQKCKNLKEIPGLEVRESLDRVQVTHCPNMTDTKRNIHGQGTLLLPASSSQEIMKDYPLCADAKGLILCFVFRFKERNKLGIEDLCISTTIHQKNKATKCEHMLRITGLDEYTSRRDIIYLHRFKGFDWFGIPLQDKDSIVIQRMNLFGTFHSETIEELKFVKLLFQAGEPNHQEPIHPVLMVADFFSWYEEKVEEEEEKNEEEERMSRPSKMRVHLHANDDQV